MSYTLGEAARVTGKSKSTIGRAIKRGDLSATIDDDGSYSIDPAELSRVYPLIHLEGNAPVAPEPQLPQNATAITIAVLQERVDQLEERLQRSETITQHLMEQNERLTLMLAAPQMEPAQPSTQPQLEQSEDEQPVPRSWWRQLFG